jgi:general secretion pathway protein J
MRTFHGHVRARIRAAGPPQPQLHSALGGSAAARAASVGAHSAAGFTLLELVIALVLLALMSAVMFGSLSMAGRTWDGGEAKVAEVSAMRQAQEFLREQLSAEYPLRLRKVAELPLLFAGERDEMRYAAALPPRVVDGGIYYFRLAVAKSGDKSQLVVERLIPDPTALQEPEFRDAERSVLADGIAELHVSYFGRDPDAADTEMPTWRDRWGDRQRLPLLVRIEVKPEKGPAWPALVVEPRRAPESGCVSYDPARNRCGNVG